MQNLKSMLERGYFPRELPPPFTTSKYAAILNSYGGSLPPNFLNQKKTAHLMRHSVPRLGTQRRVLSIPNPILHFGLCNVILSNWNDINAHCSSSRFSKTTPVLNPNRTGQSVIRRTAESDLLMERVKVRASARYILRTDISKCYSSVYSHSIPWALHGKLKAKSDRSPKLLGNVIDTFVRNNQDGQTIGIPIGPDTSLVIAEIILSAFDNQITMPLNGFRAVDDFEIGATSYREAEEILSYVRETLRGFELELNDAKTSIIELPAPIEKPWVSTLRNWSFRIGSKGYKTDLSSYFDAVFEFYRQYSTDYVLSYAITRVGNLERLDKTTWEMLQLYLFQCLAAESGTLRAILPIFQDYERKGFTIDRDLLSSILNQQILISCPLNHANEVTWALWALIYWQIPVAADAAHVISRSGDSLIALMSLDAAQRGLIASGLNTNLWENVMTVDALYGPQWLLSYEANFRRWLPSLKSPDHVAKDPNFSFLKQQGVSFYDPSKVTGVKLTKAALSKTTAPMFSF